MKKLYISIALSVALFGLRDNCLAQDVHFSQIFTHDIQTNPALAGKFNGDQRAVLSHKTQWGSIGSGFKTFDFSFDSGLLKKKWKNSYLGLGIRAFSDKAGDPAIKNNSFGLMLTDHIALDRFQSLSAGIGASFNQFSIGNTNLIWEDQYQPGTGSLGTTSESFGSMGQNFFDLSAGLAWSYTDRKTTVNDINNFSITLGLAGHHLLQPKLGPIIGETSQVDRKYTAFGKAYINMSSSNMGLIPSVLFNMQGPHKEFILGSLIRYEIDQGSRVTGFKAGMACSVGLFYRWNDAVVPTFYMEYAHFSVGVSYDVNVSQLSGATNYRGGLELSLKFVNPNPFHHKNPTRGLPSI